jgi:peptidoglycan hydrolase CwlO-like protein
MSPEKLLNDPHAPLFLGMVVKLKDHIVMKAFTVAITIAFATGVFITQTNAMMEKQDEYILKVEKLTEIVVLLQRSLDVTNNNVGHIITNMDKMTAQIGEMQANVAKIRR